MVQILLFILSQNIWVEHGTTIGGIIVDSGKFPWDKNKRRRFKRLNTPDT